MLHVGPGDERWLITAGMVTHFWLCMWAWNHVLIIMPGWSARYKPQENMFCMYFVEWWVSVTVNGLESWMFTRAPNRKSSLSALGSGCCCLSLHPGKQNFLPVWIWQWKGFLSKNESCFTTNCMTCVRFWKTSLSQELKCDILKIWMLKYCTMHSCNLMQ